MIYAIILMQNKKCIETVHYVYRNRTLFKARGFINKCISNIYKFGMEFDRELFNSSIHHNSKLI